MFGSLFGFIHFGLQRGLDRWEIQAFLRDKIFDHSRWRRKITTDHLLYGIFRNSPIE